MATVSLNPEKLQSLSHEALRALMLRTAAVQARLLETPGSALGPETRALVLFLARSVLQMEAELRRREDETAAAWVEDLDPDLVVEAA